jgi:tRNA nucleotidyltransferase (CCA-adding enzyme)
MNLTSQQRTALLSVGNRARTHIASIPQETDGLRVFVVGGAVRDALISGETEKDLDYMVIGETTESMLGRGFHEINASSFGVFHDEDHEEWALARTETKPDNRYGYKGIETTTTNVSLFEDLNRRDFRMNAMALQLQGEPPEMSNIRSGDIVPISDADSGVDAFFIDPFDGQGDIQEGIIHHVSDAFAEDPIRVLRAARYASRLEITSDTAANTSAPSESVPFTVAPETKTLMRELAPELNRMSRERVGMEVVKSMKQATNPTRFWDTLRDTGALAVIAPTLDRATIVPAGPEKYHREGDTYIHTMQVLEQMHTICESKGITGNDRVRRLLMAVCHDLGKVPLADEKGGLWSDNPPRRFGGHAQKGSHVAERLSQQLGLEGDIQKAMSQAAELHMYVHDIPTWSSSELIDFIEQHDPPESAKRPHIATVEELLDLAQADHEGRWQSRATFSDADAFATDSGAPSGAVRPVFDREVFAKHLSAARDAVESIDGYDVMPEGLCDDHSKTSIPESAIADTLKSCDQCRSPGQWIGTRVAERRAGIINKSKADKII